LVYFPVTVCYTKKNLATLIAMYLSGGLERSVFICFFVFQERCGCDSLLKLLAKVAKNLKILQVIEHTLSFYQGDQTGRIFGHWAIVYLRQFLEN
jgi:hypothetical protein